MAEETVQEFLKRIGREGGRKRAATHSKEELRKWGKRGGRPRKKRVPDEPPIVRKINKYFESTNSTLRVKQDSKTGGYCLFDLFDDFTKPIEIESFWDNISLLQSGRNPLKEW